jgi:hypothetical protein
MGTEDGRRWGWNRQGAKAQRGGTSNIQHRTPNAERGEGKEVSTEANGDNEEEERGLRTEDD